METVRRPVRSYVLRAGRIGPGQARALAAHGDRFVLPYVPCLLDTSAAFGREAPLVVEIGFGMGAATAEIARCNPGVDYLGIEVHEAGVGALLKRIGEDALENVRIVRHDAVEVLQTMLAPGSLAGIHLFFPDPWPKKRHHKRRIVQPSFAALAASRLRPGGVLHCATDWAPYAESMRVVLGSEPMLVNTADGYAPRPASRPLTKFESRGIGLGHGVFDLLFRRSA